MSLSLVIMAYSFIQSLCGVGLLIFGTPTLLLLGYSFPSALLHLLPPSLCISLLQIIDGRKSLDGSSKALVWWTVPFVILGLGLVLHFENRFNARAGVGLLLVVAAILRLSERAGDFLRTIASKHDRILLPLIGLIHGMTNMGGSLLTLYCSSFYRDKVKVRTHIALGYLVMGAFQLLTLIFFQHPQWDGSLWLFPVLAVFTYLVTKKLAFRFASERLYQQILTVLIAAFGIVLLF